MKTTRQWSKFLSSLSSSFLYIYLIKNMDANEVAINIRDHGIAVDDRKTRVKCNYCGKEMSGFTRLKYHLGGIKGDVTPCGEVPKTIQELMKSMLSQKKKGNLSKEVGEVVNKADSLKRNWCPPSNGVKDGKLDMTRPSASGSKQYVKMNAFSENNDAELVSFSKRRICTEASPSAMEELSPQEHQKSIARFFYETGIDFDASKSPSFQRMINATLGDGKTGLRIPSCQELKGRILQDEVKEMQQYVKEIRNSWARTGCSILLDGWIDGKGRNLINIVVNCPRGPIYLMSMDVSAALGNVDSLQLLLDEVIEEVGLDNVVQIVTYSSSAFMEAVGKQLMEKHRSFFWTVSASHCLELMLERIGKMDLIKGILDKAKSITKFIYSRATVLKLMRSHTNGCDIIKPFKIRSTMPFLTLENIVTQEENLKEMFASSEWSTSICASSAAGKEVADLVADHSFWTGATVVLKATIPLVSVLHLISEGDQKLGFIYETLDQAKETIKEGFKNRKEYMPYWNIIDDIWNNHLHSPLHSAGYFLNPCLFYSSDFFTDAEVASGLLCCIVRMVEGKLVQDLVSSQVDDYREGKDAFGQGSTVDRRSSVSPAQWWSDYGGQRFELKRLAIRILSQTSDGASKYRLKRSMAEQLLTKGRNPIEQQRLNDLAFVHYNLQLRNFVPSESIASLSEGIDPMDDWIVDDAQVVVLESCDPSWMELDCDDRATTSGVIIGEGSSSFIPKSPAKSVGVNAGEGSSSFIQKSPAMSVGVNAGEGSSSLQPKEEPIQVPDLTATG